MSKETKLVVVRVLATLHLEGKQYQPNQLVEISAADVATYKKNGSVDDSAGAVEYCKTKLRVEVIKHTSAEDDYALAQVIAELNSGGSAELGNGASDTQSESSAAGGV